MLHLETGELNDALSGCMIPIGREKFVLLQCGQK